MCNAMFVKHECTLYDYEFTLKRERFMSEVNATDQTLINSAEDVYDLYLGSGDQAQAGLEVEMAFFNPDTPDLDVMSLSQNRVLKNSAAAALDGDWVHNEPTSELLEVASSAADFANMRSVLDETNQKIRLLTEKAQELGLKRSYFQELPEKTADELLSKIVDVDRYQIMYAPYRADMKKCVQYFAVCKSNQVSVSHRDPAHLLENVRRLYVLAPFLFLLTDNSAGFVEGHAFKGHGGMHLRHNGLLEGRGGILPYVFSARSGEEFIAAHIEHVMNNPLFMYYCKDGSLKGVPSGDWGVTFNSLKERGLNTASNYYLGQSVLWPDVKIAALKNSVGEVFGHRYEARMFGVGMHQHQTAMIITSALAFHERFSQGVNELLERYGLGDSPELLGHVQDAYTAARKHGGQFFNIAYGNGSMADFAKDFADLLEGLASYIGMEDALLPAIMICRTGCTDAKVNRHLFPSLEETLAFQRTHDSEMFFNPNQCAKMVFEAELERSGAPCTQVRAV